MAARAKKKAGFWESDAAKAAAAKGSGKFLTGAEKAAVIDSGATLEIVGVRYDEKNQYQGNSAPRYVVTFVVPEGISGVTAGERFYGFAISLEEESSRDNLLAALLEYLEQGDTQPVLVNLVRSGSNGQFIAIEKAEA